MKKIYENPVFDLNEIEAIETSETQGQSIATVPGTEDDIPFWPI